MWDTAWQQRGIRGKRRLQVFSHRRAALLNRPATQIYFLRVQGSKATIALRSGYAILHIVRRRCMKKSTVISMMFSLVVFLFAMITIMGDASAQSLSSSLGVVAYPSKGQSAQQQSKDEGECFAWAKQQTGIDPAAVASAPTQQPGPAAGGGERARGAARGAVGGAAIGAIAGDTGKGAAAGAVVGTMAGGRQARQNKAAKEQQAQDAKVGTLQHFNKAFGVCMEGRGYAVK
jgi:hypothetical protein